MQKLRFNGVGGTNVEFVTFDICYIKDQVYFVTHMNYGYNFIYTFHGGNHILVPHIAVFCLKDIDEIIFHWKI